MNGSLTHGTGIGALTDNNGNVVVDSEAKANMLNEYFGAVGTVDNNVTPTCRIVVSQDTAMDTVT